MSATGLLKLSRPPNGLMMFFAVLVGVLFSENRNINIETAMYAFVTSFGLTSSSMALNDYFDKETDLVNNPARPIPSGQISERTAVVFAGFTAFLGLSAAFLTSVLCGLMASLTYSVSTLYNWFLKKTGFLGNLAVSFAVVAPFIYGSLLSDGTVSSRVLILALLAFLANTGREIIKGITDVEGDAVRKVSTIARKHGLPAAAKLGAAFYISAVVLSPLPYLLDVVGPLYLPVVAAADAGFIYSSVKVVRGPTPIMAAKQKNLTLLWMLLALISFAAGGIF